MKGPRPFGIPMGLKVEAARGEPDGVDSRGWHYMKVPNPPDPFCHVAACYTEETGVYCVKAYADVDLDDVQAHRAMAHGLTALLVAEYGLASHFEIIPTVWPLLPWPPIARKWEVNAYNIDTVILEIAHGEFKLQFFFDNHEQARKSLPEGLLVIEMKECGGYGPAR